MNPTLGKKGNKYKYVRMSSQLHTGGFMISGKGVHIQKGWGLALLILSHFLKKISNENEIIWSHYLILIGYFKSGAGFQRTP